MDPRCTPLVLGGHPADEIAHFARHHGSAAPHAASRETLPVEPETGPVPADYGHGLHDDEDLCPARPDATKGAPEDTIGGPDAGPAPLDHRGELLPQGDVLEQELPPRTAD